MGILYYGSIAHTLIYWQISSEGASLGSTGLLRLAPYLGRTRPLKAVAYTEDVVSSQASQQ
jgi:hypothetical protein